MRVNQWQNNTAHVRTTLVKIKKSIQILIAMNNQEITSYCTDLLEKYQTDNNPLEYFQPIDYDLNNAELIRLSDNTLLYIY